MSSMNQPFLHASSAECEQAFYEALEAADADAVAQLWLNDDDVCCIHPGGSRLVGIEAVMASWRAILHHGPVRIRAISSRSLETPTMAVHNVLEEILIVHEDQQQLMHVIATNVYVKTPSGWKMLMHHASPAASEDAAQELEAPPGLLH